MANMGKLKRLVIAVLLMAKNACGVIQDATSPIRKQASSGKAALSKMMMSPDLADSVSSHEHIDSKTEFAPKIIRGSKNLGQVAFDGRVEVDSKMKISPHLVREFEKSGKVAADGSVEMSADIVESIAWPAASIMRDAKTRKRKQTAITSKTMGERAAVIEVMNQDNPTSSPSDCVGHVQEQLRKKCHKHLRVGCGNCGDVGGVHECETRCRQTSGCTHFSQDATAPFECILCSELPTWDWGDKPNSASYSLQSCEATPTPSPTENPTPLPTENPTPSPTENPTPLPTENPTPSPTENPTPLPTEIPTPSPTESPTSSPSENPTPSPTANPTPSPTANPTTSPTENPTPLPTESPTPSPTENPTPLPTESPTPSPTENPTPPTANPTPSPTASGFDGKNIVAWKVSKTTAKQANGCVLHWDNARDPLYSKGGGDWVSYFKSGYLNAGCGDACNNDNGVNLECHYRGKSRDTSNAGVNINAFARTYLTADSKRRVTLALGSDDGIAVWLNGKLVHQHLGACRCYGIAQERVDITLKAGVNLLVIKVGENDGHFGFTAQLSDTTGIVAKEEAVLLTR